MVHPFSALYVYQQGIFPLFRISYDYTLGYLNFPFLYVLLAGLVTYGAWVLFKYKNAETKIEKVTKRMLSGLGKAMLVLLALFFWLWGFHYYQPDFSSRFSTEYDPVDTLYLREEIHTVAKQLNYLRRSIPDASIAEFEKRHDDLEDSLRDGLEPLLYESGWNISGRVRVRALRPEGVLLRFSAAGLYLPYSLEGHYDHGLHILQVPFTLAHEMAHGYGVTSEGDCNLLALVVTLHAQDPLIQYCGLLTYYRYLRSDDRFVNDRKTTWLDEIVKKDLVHIRENSLKYPDIFPFWRDHVYDWYLRIMGVEDGVKNYYTLIDNFSKVKKVKPGWVPEYLIQ